MIWISLHLYLPLGFCTLEMDALLNLRYRIKERKLYYGHGSNGLNRFLLKQHYLYHRLILWNPNALSKLALEPSSVLPGQPSLTARIRKKELPQKEKEKYGESTGF